MRGLLAILTVATLLSGVAHASDEDARGVNCPSQDLLHQSFQDDLGRFCDAQWRLTQNPDPKSEPPYVRGCKRRCKAGAAFNVPNTAPLLGLVTAISVVAITSRGGGKPASP